MTPEHSRLIEDRDRTANWKRWGPYLSERQWGTVREDYSPNGASWDYFPFSHAHARAYRWGEDGLLGFCDRECRFCFSLALWNGQDSILKERLFGLTNNQGNHGEDVKELYYYLASTPTHSYFSGLYKYPQSKFPYDELLAENGRRGQDKLEFEICDTGLFDQSRYFDVQVEYAKASPDDILIRVRVCNRGDARAEIQVLPQFWYRNCWSWGEQIEANWPKPSMVGLPDGGVSAEQASLGRFRLDAQTASDGTPFQWLFTENETNFRRIFGSDVAGRFTKDAFHRYVIDKELTAVNPARQGTKVAAHYALVIPPGESVELHLRLRPEASATTPAFEGFDDIFALRIQESDAFYKTVEPSHLSDDGLSVMRQAYAGLLWTKQFYQYVVQEWLQGDPHQPPPPASRWSGRNSEWQHLFNRDVISMPDKWEYPWYAAWDLAFHMIPFAKIDGEFAKQQLLLFLREWYMHPNGQIPAYEYAFSDVNPPVHAWACWRVYKMTGVRGARDTTFLRRTFQKLLLNFTWWVNRKDVRGKNLFSGGFLGLDNIGLFDRSQPLPTGGHLEQADGTAWMAFYCVTMLAIALELALEDPSYEDMASKFFEHFISIADAMNTVDGTGLWDDLDGFYYDHLHNNGTNIPLRVRSMVGIIPLFAVYALDEDVINRLPGFKKRFEWFLAHRTDLASHIALCDHCLVNHKGRGAQRLLAIPSRERLERMLKYILSEDEFLSPYGIRSLSKIHEKHPYTFHAGTTPYQVKYVPGESENRMFGGNSNWRGPIWFPVNYLLIEALERYHYFYGDSLLVECPTGSGQYMNLLEVARQLEQRLAKLFLADQSGKRACHGSQSEYHEDPHWKGLVLFHEYFHGDSGRGLGASHQTGWTALIATVLNDIGRWFESKQ